MANRSPNSPEYNPPESQTPPVPRVEDITGLIRTDDAIPTEPARKLNEQLRIVQGILYIYDTAADDWIAVGPPTATAVYSGLVASNAAGTPFPSGWSVSHDGTGQYTITHNLGTKLVPVFSGISAVSIPSIQSVSTTAFTVWWYSLAGNPQDTDFTFHAA